eukprot:CAMPEP_0175055274 /NCGR_PEP_ID=MMETSP0052_2-20121109/9988_1 /TAXON_ID=51329 ORGANISM="Polytomella parva, Strain SAG 63-3" /NCGR_SAMPLE_ID=MMETSP0052_2 /ASSEMBLY_ACC=CAM_ASM_000194 /LENGTH=294 /DNA_ID=CAMNT_0016320099 /DNA_START=67 /DNA_END=951 /DNA_ORIENTATION=+
MQAHARVPLEEFTSGDLSILKGGTAQEEESLRDDLTPYREPPAVLVQFTKATNYLFDSLLAALARGILNPPARKEANSVNVPEWFKEQYLATDQKVNFSKRFAKDATAFFFCFYVMDAVKSTAKAIRGVEDVWNNIASGSLAGLILGRFWYPKSVQGRGGIVFAGALYGLISNEMQNYSKRYMLEQQQILEREVFHKSEDDVKSVLDVPYLRELMRLRHEAFQKELAEKKEVFSGGPKTSTPSLLNRSTPAPPENDGSSHDSGLPSTWHSAANTVSGGNPWLVISDGEQEKSRS